MPELPEVESTVRGLREKIVGKTLSSLWTDTPKLIKGGSVAKMKKFIESRKIISVDRRAKNILIRLDKGGLILIHLKMTGHLMISKWDIIKEKGKEKAVTTSVGKMTDRVNGYIRVIFYFKDGTEMALSDLRKFAKVSFGAEEEVLKKEGVLSLGEEATEISFPDFKKAVSGSNRPIKLVIMDQDRVAGIGNIYSDDILWKAKVHPLRPASSLSDEELKEIYKAMREILKLAISLGGTSISDYRDIKGNPGGYGDRRLVYRRDNEPCPRCGTKIQRLKSGGRSGRFCPHCQKI